MTAAVVLAAGLSLRMGETDKLRLPVGGVPMYRYALALAAVVGDTCLIVTNDPAIAAEGREMGFRAVPSPRAAEGMGYSVAAGAAALDARADYALFLGADQPFLRPETVRQLVRLAQESHCIAVPRVDGKPCAPCVFPHRFFGELAALAGETGVGRCGSAMRLKSAFGTPRTKPNLPILTHRRPISVLPALTSRRVCDTMMPNKVFMRRTGRVPAQCAQKRGTSPAERVLRGAAANVRPGASGATPRGIRPLQRPVSDKQEWNRDQIGRLFGQTKGAVF